MRIDTSTPRKWIIAPPHDQRDRLAREAGVAPLVAQLLLNRGVATADEVRRFLAPEFRSLLPPETLPNAVDAARRLLAAARDRRRIVIYGDYDVDGVTATAILWHVLTIIGADVDFYVPCRFEEGYGLNAEALERIAADGGRVVVTVDCGITAVDEARRARELGIELIVTDHHAPRCRAPGRADDPPGLPEADAIVHPTACGPSPNPDLSGAGVALKVAWALARELGEGGQASSRLREALLDATALAALGLIADVVPLTGENRVIATFGLRQLCRSTNPGVRALLEASGLEGKAACDDFDVGFLLAPRLNAVGRMGHARLAVELFTRATVDRARLIARTLDAHNRERQAVERGIFQQAEKLVQEQGLARDDRRGIVLASPDWHVGVIGIVASRLVERFHRPTVLIALENGVGQGSARSVRHFPLHEALGACAAHLLSFGGHAMAAGVRLKAEHVQRFADAFVAEAGRRLTEADLHPRLHLDDQVDLDQLSPTLVESIRRMAPFGSGNRRPCLASAPLELLGPPRVVGANGAHLQFTVRQGRAVRKAIAFGRGRFADQLAERRSLQLAFEPILNDWNGRRSVELKVADWRWD